MSLSVENLPKNSLAYTNCIYLHPAQIASYKSELSPAPESSSEPKLLLNVGLYVFTALPHSSVSENGIALNGLQRQAASLTLNQVITPSIFTPTASTTASSITLTIDLLAKSKPSNPVPIDTEVLGEMFKQTYDQHVLTPGQTLAMDFEGSKLKITCQTLENLSDLDTSASNTSTITLGQILQPTQCLFQKAGGASLSLSGKCQSGGGGGTIFNKKFDFVSLGIGGLDEQFNTIFRRAFASRIWPSHVVQSMGINHCRGILLFGPPGCGKTLIARQIGKALNSHPPKIVNGPEILDKYVGGSEEKIRALFADAEKEQASQGDASQLHIIILDEMDAICKSRGSGAGGNTGVGDSVVNQLLSKIDGVDALNNILLIGMTNRKDMIDDALLRPGRLELHVEIGLPDLKGRNQILNIHTKSMREAGRLAEDVVPQLPTIAEKSKNFSGAEIEGLVRSASSFALSRAIDPKDLSKAPDISSLEVVYEDFTRALSEVEPKFGAKTADMQAYYRGGMVNYGTPFEGITETINRVIEQMKTSTKTPLMSLLVSGEPETGKTALAAHLANNSGIPFVRVISADTMIGMSESGKALEINRNFMEAYKSPLSLILIDDLERLIEYIRVGPRFSNQVLQALLVLLKKPPPEDKKLLVVATTSIPLLLEDLSLTQSFSLQVQVPMLEPGEEGVRKVLIDAGVSDKDVEAIAGAINKPIGIKTLLMVTEMARSNSGGEDIDLNMFLECLHTVGY
ncbi:hypothetical protein TrLO_g14369 [Triparma laevis f. longispina]|uniref:Vesicle-fusing ATPase n=1 Tax=Triparma laevis f. longispina TaxID=1714387 RepID=A0A9W7FVM5_9STRA|nr:hypothetical protein TrLO_g14369 [Triparma laevis f. longispina]